MSDFVTLSCPSCGGKLEITKDIERCACAFCGQEHIVKRTNSTVSLSPVVEAIHQVKAGVDKTAAELAIVRLQKEISELQARREKLLKESPPPSIPCFSIICLFLGLLVTFFAVVGLFTKNTFFDNSSGFFTFGIILLIFGFLPFILLQRNKRIWKQSIEPRLNTLSEDLAGKQKELKLNQDLVKG